MHTDAFHRFLDSPQCTALKKTLDNSRLAPLVELHTQLYIILSDFHSRKPDDASNQSDCDPLEVYDLSRLSSLGPSILDSKYESFSLNSLSHVLPPFFDCKTFFSFFSNSYSNNFSIDDVIAAQDTLQTLLRELGPPPRSLCETAKTRILLKTENIENKAGFTSVEQPKVI